MKTLRLFVIVLAVFAIVMSGCTKSTDNGGGGGGGTRGGLGWALDIARGESPVDDLLYIWGIDLGSDGRIGKDWGMWGFYFIDFSGPMEEFFIVAVNYNGDTVSFWEDADYLGLGTEIPKYRDASGWITAADGAVTGVDYNYRGIGVYGDDDGDYADTENIAHVQYGVYDEDDDTIDIVAIVLLDADTNEVLGVWY